MDKEEDAMLERIIAVRDGINNAPIPYPQVFFLDGICYEQETADSAPKAMEGLSNGGKEDRSDG